MGDIDYGLKNTTKNSIPIYYYKRSNWLIKKIILYGMIESFYKRYKNLKSPKGVPIYEYFYFNKKHFGILRGIRFLLGTFLALCFPTFYKIVTNK